MKRLINDIIGIFTTHVCDLSVQGWIAFIALTLLFAVFTAYQFVKIEDYIKEVRKANYTKWF